MSGEGFWQCFCKNRHYDKIGNLDERFIGDGLKITDLRCEECGEPFVWTNYIDDTNCDEFGYIDVSFDKDGLVALHCVSSLLQIQQQNDTGFYHTCGEWWYTQNFRQSDFVVSANGVPVVAKVPFRDVSINSQKANVKSICAVPKMIDIINQLSDYYKRMNVGDYDVNRCVEDLKGLMERSEKIVKELKDI